MRFDRLPNKRAEISIYVIPARDGSKRTPHKNILDIAGKPMIYWPRCKIKSSDGEAESITEVHRS